MEVTLVHPDDTANKVVVNHPVQLAAFKSQGFVEESELATLGASAPESVSTDELAELRAELEKTKAALAKSKAKLAAKRSEAKTAKPETDQSDESDENTEESENK